MKGKTHQIICQCILTKDRMVVEGGEYLYTEGSFKAKVILNKVVENTNWVRLDVFFPHEDKHIEISHLKKDYHYAGMWKLFDWTETSNLEVKEAEMLRAFDSGSFEPKYTKEAFFHSMDENTLTNILIHLNKINNCKFLGEKEMNLAWLSWIVGKGFLKISDQLIFHDLLEVEFDTGDYSFYTGSENPVHVTIQEIIDFYELEKLYLEILAS